MSAQTEAMKRLGMSDEEIAELLAFDKEVDRMKASEVDADLTADQKQAVKKARQADRTPTAYKFTKRERKANTDKRELMELFAESVGKVAEGVEVTNPEREMIFHFNGVKYKVVLSAPRS